MFEYVNSMLATLLVCLGLSFYTLKALVPGWNLREYSVLEDSWKSFMGWATAIGVVVSAAVYHQTGSVVMGIIFGVMVYFLMFTAQIDLVLHLAPRELTSLAILVGMLAGAAGLALGKRTVMFTLETDLLTVSLTSLGLYMAAMAVMVVGWILIEFIGFGDIKMFIATGFFASWYLGYINMIFIFMLTNIFLFLHLIINKINSKGRKSNLAALPAFALATTLGSIYLLN